MPNLTIVEPRIATDYTPHHTIHCSQSTSSIVHCTRYTIQPLSQKITYSMLQHLHMWQGTATYLNNTNTIVMIFTVIPANHKVNMMNVQHFTMLDASISTCPVRSPSYNYIVSPSVMSVRPSISALKIITMVADKDCQLSVMYL